MRRRRLALIFFEEEKEDVPPLVAYLARIADCNAIAEEREHQTPLHMAISMGCLATVRCLIETGNADATLALGDDLPNNTPLHQAALTGSLDIVQYLICRPEVDASAGREELKWTAFHAAVEGNHLDVVQYLAEEHAGARLWEWTGQGSHDRRDFRDPWPGTHPPLTKAVCHRNFEMVRYLLTLPGMADSCRLNDAQALLNAAAMGWLSMVRFLVEDYNFSPDAMAAFPFQQMAEEGDEGTDIFVKGWNRSDEFDYEATALHAAAVRGDLAIVKYLTLRAGADVLIETYQGDDESACSYLAKDLARKYRHIKVARFLTIEQMTSEERHLRLLKVFDTLVSRNPKVRIELTRLALIFDRCSKSGSSRRRERAGLLRQVHALAFEVTGTTKVAGAVLPNCSEEIEKNTQKALQVLEKVKVLSQASQLANFTSQLEKVKVLERRASQLANLTSQAKTKQVEEQLLDIRALYLDLQAQVAHLNGQLQSLEAEADSVDTRAGLLALQALEAETNRSAPEAKLLLAESAFEADQLDGLPIGKEGGGGGGRRKMMGRGHQRLATTFTSFFSGSTVAVDTAQVEEEALRRHRKQWSMLFARGLAPWRESMIPKWMCPVCLRCYGATYVGVASAAKLDAGVMLARYWTLRDLFRSEDEFSAWFEVHTDTVGEGYRAFKEDRPVPRTDAAATLQNSHRDFQEQHNFGSDDHYEEPRDGDDDDVISLADVPVQLRTFAERRFTKAILDRESAYWCPDCEDDTMQREEYLGESYVFSDSDHTKPHYSPPFERSFVFVCHRGARKLTWRRVPITSCGVPLLPHVNNSNNNNSNNNSNNSNSNSNSNNSNSNSSSPPWPLLPPISSHRRLAIMIVRCMHRRWR